MHRARVRMMSTVDRPAFDRKSGEAWELWGTGVGARHWCKRSHAVWALLLPSSFRLHSYTQSLGRLQAFSTLSLFLISCCSSALSSLLSRL